jgi:uncharacterized damage-inducible protein DinB
MPTELLAFDPPPAAAPEVGRAIWALEDVRRLTLERLQGIDAAALDWAPPGGNSIRTLLYHIGAIELDWLCAEVLELRDFPPDLTALFPYDVRDDRGRLAVVPALDLSVCLERLGAVRARLRETFLAMPAEEFYRARRMPTYDVTPEWVLHHLSQHETEHRGEIALLRQLHARGAGGG